jgi:hypothetical protein
MLRLVVPSVAILSVFILVVAMLRKTLLTDVMLIVTTVIVIGLNVMAPFISRPITHQLCASSKILNLN